MTEYKIDSCNALVYRVGLHYTSFNLAPLLIRRDISILGVLHKVGAGTSSMEIRKLFAHAPQASPPPYPFRIGFHLTRLSHTRQIDTKCTRLSTERFKRSAYGLVAFYNALPQWLVDISSTNTFQRVVQKAVIRISSSSETNWHLWIRDGWKQRTCNQLDAAL